MVEENVEFTWLGSMRELLREGTKLVRNQRRWSMPDLTPIGKERSGGEGD
jgi:hypothetical protein